MVGRNCRRTHSVYTHKYACIVYVCVAKLYAYVAKLYTYVFMFISSHECMPQHAYAYTGPRYAYIGRAYAC